MKKYSILLFAAMAVAACSKEGVDEAKYVPVQPAVSNLELRAAFEGEQTRLTTDDGLTFSLEENTETLGVYIETEGTAPIENRKFTAGAAYENGWVPFTPESGVVVQSTSKIYAYAPYKAPEVEFQGKVDDSAADNTTRAAWDGTRIVNLPSQQQQTEAGNAAHLADYYTIVATPATPAITEEPDKFSVDLQFSGVFATVKFVLRNDESEAITVSKLVLSSEQTPLSGNFAVDLRAENPKLANTAYVPQPVEGKTENSVTVSLATPVVLNNAEQAELYAVVNAGAIAAGKIEVYASMNGTEMLFTKQLTDKKIAREQRAAFGVPLKDGVVRSDRPAYDEAAKTYTITNVSELKWVAEQTNAGNTFSGETLVLAADIDLNNMDWTPIGADKTPFQGTFEGANYTISNLKAVSDGDYVGLFGYSESGSIKNLVIENANVKGGSYVAALVGNAYTTKTSNITIKGDIYIEGYVQDIGALTGYSYGNITDVTVEANPGSYVKGSSYFGGVVGYLGEGKTTLTRVKSNIDVIGKYSVIGGITGFAQYGNIFIDCSCSGNISLTEGNPSSATDWLRIGGIAGCWNDELESYVVTLSNCSFTGTLSSRNTNGDEVSEFDFDGMVGRGYMYPGLGTLIINDKQVWPVEGGSEPAYDEVTNTYTVASAAELAWIAEQTNAGNDFSGQTVALANDIDLMNVEWTPIGTKEHGFAGTFNGNKNTISNLNVVNTASPASAGLFGCVSGTVKNLTIDHATISSSNTADGYGTAVAVALGYPSATIESIKVNDATINSHRQTGGIVGYLYGTVAECEVSNATITVTPNLENGQYDNGDKVGGIVGFMGGDIGNCYSNAVTGVHITAYRDAGGITGILYAGSVSLFIYNTVKDSSITLDNSKQYASASDNAGAIVGRYADTSADKVHKSNVATNVTVVKPETQVSTAEQAAAAINAGGKVTVVGAIDKIDLTALDPAADVELVLNAAVGEIVLGSNKENPAHTTITVAKDVDYPVFSVVSGCDIENLTIIGDNTSSKACTSGLDFRSLGVPAVKNVTIDGVRFDGKAIDFSYTKDPQAVQNIVIEHCIATNLIKPFFSCSMNSTYTGAVIGDITIRNNMASFSPDAANTINGIYLCESSTGTILIEGNTITNAPKHGFYGGINKCENLIIRSNTIVNPVEDGIKLDNHDNNLTIENNTITATEYGVRIARFAADKNPNITITGNRIDMSNAKAIAGISIAQSEAFGTATLTIKDNVKVSGNPSEGWFAINETLVVNEGSDIATPFNN